MKAAIVVLDKRHEARCVPHEKARSCDHDLKLFDS